MRQRQLGENAMGKPLLEQSASPGAQLLLSPDTTVRCPACEHEFSLEQGFARKALEHLEQHSRGALAAMESQVKQEVERRAATHELHRLEQLVCLSASLARAKPGHRTPSGDHHPEERESQSDGPGAALADDARGAVVPGAPACSQLWAFVGFFDAHGITGNPKPRSIYFF